MSLQAGSRIGGYEILEPIGAGGMGEVYRARDTKLGRDVAIKVLPDELARVQERLDRFEREAKLLAALNHANVATLYGLERVGDQQFLVMELVEGETLAERIERGPIPFEEARALFVQIAEGLEAAHDKGIIHRDLKPANIKITPEGKIKILDFGLAKAFAPDEQISADTSQSPTLTKGTAIGAIMGTAGYMSPEQARGKLVDRRTDVWAFGCCLFEALTARRTFDGETVPDTLTEVLGKEPDWTRLPAPTPRRVRDLLERTLRKDLNRRLQHVGDARVELLDVVDEPASDRRPGLPPWIWGAAVALVALGFLARMIFEPPIVSAPSAAPFRAKIPLPDGARLVVSTGTSTRVGRYPPVAISRNGAHVAFVATGSHEVRRVYVRPLAALEARALEGTEQALFAFFSPDGEWVGFLTMNGRISKVPVSGGVPTTIGDTPFGLARGATWVSDDTIVLGGRNSALVRMNALTGDITPLTAVSEANRENYHAWPHALPDEEHVLFTNWGANEAEIWVVSLITNEWRPVEGAARATQAHYVDPGHLVFFRDGGIFVAPFSTSTLTLDGPAVSVPQKDLVVGWDGGIEQGYFAVSRSGSLVVVSDEVDLLSNQLVRVDRNGDVEPIARQAQYRDPPAVSPDGKRVLVQELFSVGDTLGLYDIERRSRTPLTWGLSPTFSADGRDVFAAWFESAGDSDLFVAPVDGSATSQVVLERPYDQIATDASDDGKFLVFQESHPETSEDLHLLPLDGGEAAPFEVTPANEAFGAFSPDSRFLAFTSDESGQPEIYVRAVTGDRGKILVSSDGGFAPRFSPTGRELFFRRGTAMMSVPVELKPEFRSGTPELLFDGDYAVGFDVFPDGDHFAMVTRTNADLREIEIVVNWSTELAELVPVP